MNEEIWKDPLKGPSSSEVAFDYVKSHDFRVIWADGAVGGITPQGMIHFALYAERLAIPRRQVFSLSAADAAEGRLGPEVKEKQITRGSVVREMACDVFLTPTAAENLANWLLDRAAEHKAVVQGVK